MIRSFEKKSGVLKKPRNFEKIRSFEKRSGVLKKDPESLGLNPYYVNGLRIMMSFFKPEVEFMTSFYKPEVRLYPNRGYITTTLLMSISDNSERIITKTKLTRLESHGKVINVTKVSLSLIVSKRMIFKVKFLILRILVRVNASGNRERINDKNKIKESLETA